MTTLTIVRHGNTFSPDEPPRRIGARTDLPLTKAGHEQGVALGRHFAALGLSFDRVLSSPLRRTMATASAILSELEAAPPIETADFLVEIDHGPDENEPEAAVLARIGRDALEDWDERGVAPPGWEIGADWRERRWHEFVAGEAAAEGNALLVTSNGAARCALLALGLQSAAPSLKLRTGAYGVIALGGDGAARLVEWDRRP